MLWGVLLACADSSLALKSAGVATEGDESSYDDALDTAGEAAGADVAPTHWTLRGDLVVNAGVVDRFASTLALLVVDPSTQAISCEVTVAVEGATLAEREPFAPWWTGLTTGTDACAAVPTSMSVGAGPLQAELRARLEGAGLGDAPDPRGAYVEVAGGEILGLGAFTHVEFDTVDTAAPADARDGIWTLTPLFAVAIDVAEGSR